MPTSVMALFCEDVRREASGQFTLIGLFTDNIEVASLPAAIPKLGLYIRAQMDTSDPAPAAITIRFVNTDGNEIPVAQWDSASINTSRNNAIGNHSPIYGLISSGVWAPVHLPQTGRAFVEVDIDGARYIGGVLNVSTPQITASQPPS